MNTCTFTGRIANDIILNKTQNGKSVMNINLAVKRNKDSTDFIPIVLWGQTADYIHQYSKKGDLIGVYNGTLQSRKWEDQTRWEVHAFSAEILSHAESKNRSDGNSIGGDRDGSRTASILITEEDLPF